MPCRSLTADAYMNPHGGVEHNHREPVLRQNTLVCEKQRTGLSGDGSSPHCAVQALVTFIVSTQDVFGFESRSAKVAVLTRIDS